MRGIITLDELRLEGIIGVYPEEWVAKREIFVTLELQVDFTACAQSDEVADTVHYGEVAQFCHTVLARRKYHLLENFAAALLEGLFLHFPIKGAKITVKKKQVLAGCAACAITVERWQNGF